MCVDVDLESHVWFWMAFIIITNLVFKDIFSVLIRDAWWSSQSICRLGAHQFVLTLFCHHFQHPAICWIARVKMSTPQISICILVLHWEMHIYGAIQVSVSVDMVAAIYRETFPTLLDGACTLCIKSLQTFIHWIDVDMVACTNVENLCKWCHSQGWDDVCSHL